MLDYNPWPGESSAVIGVSMRKIAGLVASIATSAVLACTVFLAPAFADPALESADLDGQIDVSTFQKLEEVEPESDEAVALSADARVTASADEDWGFEAYIIPKTTYTDSFIPIYIKTKFEDKFYLNFYDSDGNEANVTRTQLAADDIVGEWNGYDYKLQNADGRIITYSFDKVGTYTMAVVAADGYYDGPTLAKFKFTIDVDYDQAENEYIDWLIANVTDSSMDSFEKMQAIENYLHPKMKYLRAYKDEDGHATKRCNLLEDYCNPWWKSFVGNSYTTPAILCRIANRVGGFTEVHNCYWDYAPPYGWLDCNALLLQMYRAR